MKKSAALFVCFLFSMALAGCGGGSSGGGGGASTAFAGNWRIMTEGVFTAPGGSTRVTDTFDINISATGVITITNPSPGTSGSGQVTDNNWNYNGEEGVSDNGFTNGDQAESGNGDTCDGSVTASGTIADDSIFGSFQYITLSCNGVSVTYSGAVSGQRI